MALRTRPGRPRGRRDCRRRSHTQSGIQLTLPGRTTSGTTWLAGFVRAIGSSHATADRGAPMNGDRSLIRANRRESLCLKTMDSHSKSPSFDGFALSNDNQDNWRDDSGPGAPEAVTLTTPDVAACLWQHIPKKGFASFYLNTSCSRLVLSSSHFGRSPVIRVG